MKKFGINNVNKQQGRQNELIYQEVQYKWL